MIDLNFVARLQYLPSGKFDAARFSGGSILLVLGSCVTGVVAGFLYSEIAIVPILYYLTILVPIAVALLLAWFVAKFVRFSHCRNPLAATVVGVVCAVVAFLSACQIVGAVATVREGKQTSFLAAVTRPDQIKRAIVNRVFGPVLQQQEGEASSTFYIPESIMIMIEIGILIWIPTKSGRAFSRRAYGEAIDCWLDRSIVRANSGSGDRIISVLEAGDYLVETLSSLPLCSTDPRPNCPTNTLRWLTSKKTGDIAAAWLVLEVSPFPAANGAYEAYLTATEIDTHGKKRPLFHQLKLRSHEIAAARKLFMEPSSDRKVREATVENKQMEAVTTGRQIGETSDKSVLHGI